MPERETEWKLMDEEIKKPRNRGFKAEQVESINCLRMVPGAGIEPARCFHRQILSLLRLPIPPPRQRLCIIADLPLESNRNAYF